MDAWCQDIHILKQECLKLSYFFSGDYQGPQKLRQISQMKHTQLSTCWSTSPPCGGFDDQQQCLNQDKSHLLQ